MEMIRRIKLTQGRHAIVDAEDYEAINAFKWQFNKGYADRSDKLANGKRPKIIMHRFINNTPDGLDTDHINHNGLDNRKINLRNEVEGIK